jgi:hypothetical protein
MLINCGQSDHSFRETISDLLDTSKLLKNIGL